LIPGLPDFRRGEWLKSSLNRFGLLRRIGGAEEGHVSLALAMLTALSNACRR
jgi:hypothetical protein